jgi:hypothetical protein
MWEPPVGGFCPLQRQVRNGGVGGSGGAADPEIPVRSGRGSYTVIYTHRYVVSGIDRRPCATDPYAARALCTRLDESGLVVRMPAQRILSTPVG